MLGFNTDSYNELKGYEQTGKRIKLEIRRNSENGNVVFGSNCQSYPATLTEVNFGLNSSMKEAVTAKRDCAKLSIAALKKTEANTHSVYTIRAMVNIGNDDLESIETRYGTQQIKRDLFLSDTSGNVNFQLFRNKLNMFQDGKSYQITHIKLNRFRGNVHVSLTSDSEVTEIEPIINAAKKEVRKTINVDQFASIRNVKFSYICRSCRKDIQLPDENEGMEKVQCGNAKCGARAQISKLKTRFMAEVNIDLPDGSDVWLTILDKELSQVLSNNTSSFTDVENVENALEEMRDFQLEVDMERSLVKRIAVNSSLNTDDNEHQRDGDDVVVNPNDNEHEERVE